MPIDIDAKIDNQTLEANESLESWPITELSNKSKIIAFISPDDDLGMAALLSKVAASMCALNRQTKVLCIDGDTQAGGDIKLLSGMDGVTDYLLVRLPSQPNSFARTILLNCDLIIVTSSCKIEFLPAAENIVKALLYLGIDTEKVAGLLFDPEGILSSTSLADIKPYLEDSLGLEMAGVVSFESDSEGWTARDIEALVQYIIPHDSPKLESVLVNAG